MKHKRTKEDDGDESPMKRFYDEPSSDEPGTSLMADKKCSKINDPLELLEFELQQPQLNVQEIGKIIAEGMLEKTLSEESLRDLTIRFSKSVQSINNIDIWSLSDELSKGVIDSRLVVIGNAFLWNLLKSSMSSVRDKFDQYHLKMSNMASSAAAAGRIDFASSRADTGQFIVLETSIFRSMDLFDLFSNVVFRKTGDVVSKGKQFIKAYLTTATNPKCYIWHYSLRQSGTSHKKTLQDFPSVISETLFQFMLTLAGLGDRELLQNFEHLSVRTRFYASLGDSDQEREIQFEQLKSMRDNLLSKFRNLVTDVLNEIREMPYNTVTCELLPPPRGKPMDTHQCVTWRQYETLLKKCSIEPSRENVEAKDDLEFKLNINYHQVIREEEVDIDVEVSK
uniref:Uncharacterized protein n=1 Tax=Caenorhabditis japonica TaxID=281687 RepID=A0A8R1DJ78_CAEJA